MANNYIKEYLYGYLNIYLLEKDRFSTNYKTTKEMKIHRMLIYLGRDSETIHKLLNSFTEVILIVEIPLTILILLVKLVIATFKTVFSKNTNVQGKVIVIAPGVPISRILEFNRSIPNVETCKLWIPFEKMIRNKYELTVYDRIELWDVWMSFWDSILTLFILVRKYGRRDILFRSFSSFSYYLTGRYLEKLDGSNTVVFYDLINRWAYLISNVYKGKKLLIQHGSLNDTYQFVRFNAPETVYYINHIQKQVLDRVLFSTEPVNSFFRPLIILNSEEKLKNNGLYNVLLICCPKYLDKECMVIDKVTKCGKYNLYIKTHPGFKDVSEYLQLQKRYGFTMLEKTDFPPIDFAISYDSTLADQYSDLGVQVLKYTDKSFEKEFDAIVS